MSFPIAIQAIVVYVNKANPVNVLTITQMRSIFLGEITNWKQLGGRDERPEPCSTPVKAAPGWNPISTKQFFEGRKPTRSRGKQNTHALLETLANDPSGIGYRSLDVGAGVHTIGIKLGAASVPVESPTRPASGTELTLLAGTSTGPLAINRLGDCRASVLGVFPQKVSWSLRVLGFQPLLPDQRKQGLAKPSVKPSVLSASYGK